MKLLIGDEELIASYWVIQSAGYNAVFFDTKILWISLPTMEVLSIKKRDSLWFGS